MANVEKIGNSTKNIHVINDVVSQDEHKKILDFVINVKGWNEQPWGVDSLFSQEIPKEINNILSKIFEVAYNNFVKFYDVDISTLQTFNVVRFKEGYSMHLHADVLSYAELHLASVYYINDDYEGGEINFPDHNLMIKPKANSLILFPGNENYWHETLKVVGKDRYTSTKFFKFTGSKFHGRYGDGKKIY